jgi:hypothetical protein
MKKSLAFASVALALLAGGLGASAQTSTTTTTTTQQTTVTNEQQSRIKAYVTKQRPRAVTAPSGFTVTTGAVLPEAVELESFPADVGVNYRYTVIGDRTVVVEPGTRRIIEVID